MLVHRPAPRVAVLFSMCLMLAVVLPAAFLAPERVNNPGGWFGLSFVGLFEVGLLAILRRRVEISLEGDQLMLKSKRWPFANRTDSFKRQDISAVELEWRPRGRSVRLSLKFKNGKAHPVTNSYFGHSSGTDADLTALRSMLSIGKND